MPEKAKIPLTSRVILIGGSRSKFRRALDDFFGETNVAVHRKGTIPWEVVDTIRKGEGYKGDLLLCHYNSNGGQRYYVVDSRGNLKQGAIDLNTCMAVSISLSKSRIYEGSRGPYRVASKYPSRGPHRVKIRT